MFNGHLSVETILPHRRIFKEQISRTQPRSQPPQSLSRKRESFFRVCIRCNNSTMSVFEETDYSIESPASKGTLSGLNSTRIVNNPKLRHDINFGPELHFRPNLAGEKVARSTIRRLNPFMEPPVTKGTLSELDVTRIVNNPASARYQFRSRATL